MVLSSLSPEEVENAIISEDVRTIQEERKRNRSKNSPGIILELKDKLGKETISGDLTNLIKTHRIL